VRSLLAGGDAGGADAGEAVRLALATAGAAEPAGSLEADQGDLVAQSCVTLLAWLAAAPKPTAAAWAAAHKVCGLPRFVHVLGFRCPVLAWPHGLCMRALHVWLVAALEPSAAPCAGIHKVLGPLLVFFLQLETKGVPI